MAPPHYFWRSGPSPPWVCAHRRLDGADLRWPERSGSPAQAATTRSSASSGARLACPFQQRSQSGGFRRAPARHCCRLLAGDHVVRLRHRLLHLAAGCLRRAPSASSRESVGSVPVSTRRLAGQRSFRRHQPQRRRVRPSRMPAARSCSTTSRLWAAQKKVRMLLRHHRGPTSFTSSACSTPGVHQRIEP